MPLHFLFNLGIATAYYLIPAALAWTVLGAWANIPIFFRAVILQFSLFIAACATGHLMQAFDASASAIIISHGVTCFVSFAVALQMPLVAKKTIAFIQRSIKLRQDLQRSQAQMNAFLSCPRIMAWIKDERLQIVYNNEPLIQNFGDLVGTRDRDRDPALESNTEQNDLLVLETGQPYECVETVASPNGQPRYWLS
jgi:hypothetical protein